ncbi:MAG: ribonuclease P protein component [Bacteroidales bacterium]|nr:ribonuclease P protein component [Bacteroidales bacterium]
MSDDTGACRHTQPLKLSFGKQQHLCGEKNITTLFSRGKHLNQAPVKTVYVFVPAEAQPVRVLVSVPKRLFRKAHDRNLLKRRLREAYRRNKHILYHTVGTSGFSLRLAFVYTASDILSYSEIENKIVLSLQRLNIIVQQKIQHNENSSR